MEKHEKVRVDRGRAQGFVWMRVNSKKQVQKASGEFVLVKGKICLGSHRRYGGVDWKRRMKGNDFEMTLTVRRDAKL